MARFPLAILPLAIALTATACGVQGGHNGKDVAANSEDPELEWVPNASEGLVLGQPYNSVTGTFPSASSCVSALTPSRPLLTTTSSLKAVTTQRDLANELGIDVSLTLGGAAAASPATRILEQNPSLSIVTGFRASKTLVTVVLHATVAFEVRSLGGVDPAFRASRLDAPQEVLQRCGDKYISALRYTAQYLSTIRFDADSEQDAQAIVGGLNGAASPEEGAASLKAIAHQNVSSGRAQRTAEITTTTVGILPTQLPGICIPGATVTTPAGTTSATLPVDDVVSCVENNQRVLEAAFGAMKAEAEKSPGEVPASFRLTNIGVKSLARTTTDVPAAFRNAMEEGGELSSRVESARNMLRHSSDLELRLAQAYDEMRAFETTSTPELYAFASEEEPFLSDRARYNLPEKDPDIVAVEKQIVAELRKQLDPENDSPRLALRRAIGRCYQAAKYFDDGALTDAGPSGVCSAESERAAIESPTAALNAYLATGRIVPMAVHVLGFTAIGTAVDTCKTLYDGRLPSLDESFRMYPLILKTKTRMWVNGGGIWTTALCGMFFHQASDGHGRVCDFDGTQNQALCVERDGLFSGMTNL